MTGRDMESRLQLFSHCAVRQQSEWNGGKMRRRRWESWDVGEGEGKYVGKRLSRPPKIRFRER